MSEVSAVTSQMKHVPGKPHRGYAPHPMPVPVLKPAVEFNNNTLPQGMMYTSPPPPYVYTPPRYRGPQEDEFVPFESPMRNKFGPISRSDKVASTSDPAPQSLASLFLSAGPPSYIIGQPSQLYAKPGGKLFDEGNEFNAKTRTKLFEGSDYVNSEYDLRCLEKDLRLNLGDDKLLSPQKIPYELLGQSSRSWTDDSCCWTSEEYRSDEEESYEVGIANDMRELELRWEVELKEHEKRWSSEEDPVASKY